MGWASLLSRGGTLHLYLQINIKRYSMVSRQLVQWDSIILTNLISLEVHRNKFHREPGKGWPNLRRPHTILALFFDGNCITLPRLYVISRQAKRNIYIYTKGYSIKCFVSICIRCVCSRSAAAAITRARQLLAVALTETIYVQPTISRRWLLGDCYGDTKTLVDAAVYI